MNAPSVQRTLALILLWACASCQTIFDRPSDIPASLTPAEVPQAIESSRAELAAGDALHSLARMRVAHETKGLEPAVRNQVQALLEESAGTVLAELEDPEDLEDMFSLDLLPPPLAISAGIKSARMLYADAERADAFHLIEEVDQKFPGHHERLAAGTLLSEIGFSFARDDGHYFLLFAYRDHAPQVLEYLVLNYPNHATCDLAYWTLAQMYEEGKDWEIAIERLEDLLLYHPNSLHAAEAQARVPRLRLASISDPTYDRGGLKRALGEAENWLASFPDHELRPAVEKTHNSCLTWLARNHLSVAGFYETVENDFGAHYHALRSAEYAERAGKTGILKEARATLERHQTKQEEPLEAVESTEQAGAENEAGGE